MNSTDVAAFQLLEELLIQIRGIAGEAINAGYSSATPGDFKSPQSACEAIFRLANAAHNLPAILDPQRSASVAFLADNTFRDISNAGGVVFGRHNPFTRHMA